MPSSSRAIVVVVLVDVVVEGAAVVVEVVEVVVVVGAFVVVGVGSAIGSSAAQLVAHATNTAARIVDRVVCLVLVEHLSGLVGCSILRSFVVR
jgi:hypothetical protein